MKVIFSHDIDHLTVKEHLSDTIIPKFIIRNKIELFTGKISFKEFNLRIKKLFKNKLNNIEELIKYNEKHDIPGTFFIGVNNGVGLNYSLELASEWISFITKSGVDCGVHGIAYDKYEDVKKEYDLFKSISGLTDFGIRMHYLRNDKNTFSNLSGRPMSVTITRPATVAKPMAIISAIRAIGVIHFMPVKPKTAVISIPIKLAATKNTKFAIYKPHET
jgi:hypothetical protein